MLRQATSKDVSNIQAILNKPENLEKLEGYSDQTIIEAIHGDQTKVLIWEEDHSWKGFCWLSRSEKGVKIEEFGVRAPGQGVGSRFFTAVIDDFNLAGTQEPLWLAVAADNIDAIRFYERFGFVHSKTKKAAWKRRKGPVADAMLLKYQP